VAGDSAIGDTLFYLGQALHSEVIEVEKYLKQTRFLAREQFMRRALAQKITAGMGW
jgi:ESCRT-I complex subunit TSG101